MVSRLSLLLPCLVLLMAQACPQSSTGIDAGGTSPTAGTTTNPEVPLGAADGEAPSKPKVVLPAMAAENAPAESPRIDLADAKLITERTTSYFAGRDLHRVHIQVDKPIYKPGETIWLRAWDLRARDLGTNDTGSARYELVSPKGAVVIKKSVGSAAGLSTNDFELPEDVQGGEYIIRVTNPTGTVGERPVIVSTYEPPRVLKKLEFVRKAYGANDVVSATLELKRPTGEVLANRDVVVVGRLDGVELPRGRARTDAYGATIVKLQLPPTIAVGDGLLTVMVEEGGVTESISKAIPIVMRRMRVEFFPEGGTLISGIESRIYFEARTALAKPADVSGDIIDDTGNTVARFSSHKNGLGRFSLTPAIGRTYRARITQPVGIVDEIALPLSNAEGCVLRTYDDVDGQRDVLPATVRCTTSRSVTIASFVRDSMIDVASVAVTAGQAATVHLRNKDGKGSMGVARVTLMDDHNTPMAERIVFRGRRQQLQVKVKPNQASYSPRDAITLAVETTDTSGKPVAADLAVSVVDDTVVSFADDKTGHMLSRLFLEPELPEKIEEPNIFFDLTDDKSALALEMLMGTRGYRRFEWQQALQPPVLKGGLGARGIGAGGGGMVADMLEGDMAREGEAEDAPRPRKPAPRGPPRPKAAVAQAAPAPEPADLMVEVAPIAAAAPAVPPPPAIVAPVQKEQRRAQANEVAADDAFAQDKEWAGAEKKKDRAGKMERRPRDEEERVAMAVVRVFPAPRYDGAPPAVRSDFRETLHWAPRIQTDKNGKGTVTFYASDAVTALRVFTEGVGAGLAGRDESVLSVKLPFSLSAKLPTEVSAGDRIDLPVTLTNETGKAIDVDLKGSFGSLLTIKGDAGISASLSAAGSATASKSSFFSLDVTGVQGKTPVALSAAGSGLSDDILRELTVVPRGFPMEQELAGTVKDKVSHTVNIGEAMPGTIDAYVRFYPSPTSTLLSGLEGMLREPNGCFEQTSSTNYPNVMIMSYLQKNDIAAPEVSARASKLISSGYRKLAGFETPQKGYEWFGGAPGHEALTAYGLLEFRDMQAVSDEVDTGMMTRTSAWLKSRRDGKGGYQRNDRALDSFGGASPEVTNGYITYALSEAKMASDLGEEVSLQKRVAADNNDAYLLALATNTLFNVGETVLAKQAAKRLVSMQGADGSWQKANHSITRSGGENLIIETTSLAILALLKSGDQMGPTRKAVEWLMAHRSSYGQWGTTQATVLALQAFIRYAEASRATQGPGSVIVQINGKVVGNVAYQAGHKDPIVIANLGKHMTSGANEIKLLVDGQDALPYTAGVEWRATKPKASPEAVVELAVTADKSAVKMGETVRVTATITNKTDKGQPMTIARIGIPGGMAFQVWQLKKLKDDGVVDFWETRAREVIVYFRALAPSAKKVVPIDLVANVAGHYEAPSSSAYLYYTDEHKAWVAPLVADIAR
jgi:alpha-2-macroglobulin-like protein